jgi:hypothetical protein
VISRCKENSQHFESLGSGESRTSRPRCRIAAPHRLFRRGVGHQKAGHAKRRRGVAGVLVLDVGVPGAILAVPMLAILKIISDRLRPLKALGHFLEGE